MFLRRFTTTGITLAKKKPETLASILGGQSKNTGSSKALLGMYQSRIDLPPRTGPYVGRSVSVSNPQQLQSAIRQLNFLNSNNKIIHTKRLQRFAERPGKARLRLRIERKRREFQAGIRQLFDLVNKARRKGY